MEARCCWWIFRAGYVQEELQKCAPEILTGRKRKTREGSLRVSHRRHNSPSRDVKRNKSKSKTEDRLQPPQAPPPLIGSEVTLTVLDGIIDLGSVSLCELIAMAFRVLSFDEGAPLWFSAWSTGVPGLDCCSFSRPKP